MIGIFLTVLAPKFGPEFRLYMPDHLLPEEAHKVAFKSLPLSSKAGDFASIIFKDFQYVSLIEHVEPLEPESDTRQTPIAIGFILEKTDNPVPYYEILGLIVSSCKKADKFNLKTLIALLKYIYKNKEHKKVTFKLTEKQLIKIDLPQKADEKKGFDRLSEVLWSN